MTFEEFQEYIKNETPAENCPVSKTLELFAGKWTSRVIYELEKADRLRFGQLKKKLDGITNTMLSGTLKVLEETMNSAEKSEVKDTARSVKALITYSM